MTVSSQAGQGICDMVRPHPIIRLALHAPVEIYEHGFGRLLGKRFVRLSHGGSDTCDCRTVLEVIGANGDEVMVIAGLGPSCEWFRDINSGAPVSVELGGTTFPADHRVLGEPEAVAVIADYERRHWLIRPPLVYRVMGDLALPGLRRESGGPRRPGAQAAHRRVSACPPRRLGMAGESVREQ